MIMELREIRVVHYGLGAIGSSIAHLTSAQRGLQVVGGIDHDPAKVGRDLGEVIGLAHPLDIVIADDADMVLEQARPDVVILATTSLFHEVYPQILACIRARANVISTCEELIYPYAKSPAPSAEINRLALLSGVTVLGVGVNPGYIMDLLPLILTAPCVDIRRISVTRVVDATNRRAGLQQRIGAGLSHDEFHDHVARGAVRHAEAAQDA
jgi:2,4-diaminopentanoate dehydrogenase